MWPTWMAKQLGKPTPRATQAPEGSDEANSDRCEKPPGKQPTMALPTAPQIPATRRRMRSSMSDMTILSFPETPVQQSTYRRGCANFPAGRVETPPTSSLMPGTRTTLCGLLALVLALLLPGAALAHTVGLSTGEYTAHGSTSWPRWRSRGTRSQLRALIDRNRDGRHGVGGERVEGIIMDKILRRIRVTQMGVECTPALDDAG